MRKLLIALAVFACGQSSASDIIVTKTQDKIEGKILEVSDSEIRYKKSSNLDGPTFVLAKDKISTIVYENGEVEVMKEVSGFSMISKSDWTQNTVGKLKFDKHGEVTGKRNVYYNEDKSVIMTAFEFTDFIKIHCPEAYQARSKALSKVRVGGALIFIVPISVPLIVGGNKQNNKVVDIYNENCAN